MGDVTSNVIQEELQVYLGRLGFGEEQSILMARFMVSRLETLARKRQDYGSANIQMTGLPGVSVRLLDKAARLWNLQGKKAVVAGETNMDTIGDIFGYSLIGAVLLEGEEW